MAAVVSAALLLLTTLFIGFTVYRNVSRGRHDSAVNLAAQVNSLIQIGNYAQAASVVSRLRDAAPENKDYRFQLAVIEQARGNLLLTRELMTELVSAQDSRAAQWMLKKDFEGQNFEEWEEGKRQRFEELIRVASSGSSESDRIYAKNFLASYQLGRGQLKEALDTFEQIAALHPPAGLNAASLALLLKEHDRSHRHAAMAKAFYEQAVTKQPRDDLARIHLARALMMLEREEEALMELSIGFELTRQPRLQQAAGESLVMWSNRLAARSGNAQTLLPRLQLLHRASQCAPNDQAVLEAMLKLISEFQQQPVEIAELLGNSLAKGMDRESAHFMLGMLKLLDGNSEAAQMHLDLATSIGTHVPTVLNNLALEILKQPNGQLESALSFADCACQRLPGQSHLSETRGRIFMRLERWEEAISALNQGLENKELGPLIYPNLVLAHRKLGHAATAAQLELVSSEMQSGD